MALSYIYVAYGDVGFVDAFFFGLKAAVLAIVLNAVPDRKTRAGKPNNDRARGDRRSSAIFFFSVPFRSIVFGAGRDRLFGGRNGAAANLPPLSGGHGQRR